MVLNRNGVVPLYFQIRQKILESINSGEWEVGEQIPSGPALSRKFRVSVMTVRQATSELIEEGVLISRRGKGTFVAPPKLAIRLPYFLGFTEEMKLRGFEPETRILGKGLIDAGSEIAESLKIPVGSQVAYYERLRLADKEPICFETSYLSVARFPDFPVPQDGYYSFYEIFQEHYGIEVVKAEQVLHARKATEKQARVLKIPVDSPVFLFISTELDGNGDPVQLSEGIYRGDRYSITFERIKKR
ncbi:MAG: GntR family transcriptional regulator [Firmicutes bacterium]|jgi:GntR family transcriptional regulator|nr:GntR family transcriptional regulator [Bacillota bacterium]